MTKITVGKSRWDTKLDDDSWKIILSNNGDEVSKVKYSFGYFNTTANLTDFKDSNPKDYMDFLISRRIPSKVHFITRTESCWGEQILVRTFMFRGEPDITVLTAVRTLVKNIRSRTSETWYNHEANKFARTLTFVGLMELQFSNYVLCGKVC